MAINIPSIGRIGSEARALILVGAAINFGGAFYFVALSVYLSVAGFNPTTIGLLLAVESVVGFTFAIPMAMLSDIHGRKPFFIIGVLMASISGVILYFSLNLALIVLAAILSGLANSLLGAPAGALLAEKAANDAERNDVFTLWSFYSGIANAIGALVSGALPALFQTYFAFNAVSSFHPLFALSAFIGMLAILFIHFNIHEKVQHNVGPITNVSSKKSAGSYRSFIKIPRKSSPVVFKFSVLGLIGLGAGLIIPLFPLWFHLRFNLDISVIGPLFSAMLFVTAFGSLFTPALARRRGSVTAIVLTQISSIPLLIFIPFAPNYALAGVAMVTRNMFMNVSSPIQHSFQMGLIYPDERATATSIIQTFDAVPRAFAPAIGGYMFSLGLLSLPFFFTAVLYTASILLFYILFRNVKPLDFQSAVVDHRP